MFVGHQAPPNPAAFADEVFDPTTVPPFQARPGYVRPSFDGSFASSMAPSWATLPVATFDPTTQAPPMATPPTIHLPSTTGALSSVSLINPATFPDEVFNPTTRAPWFANPGLQGYVKLILLRRAPGVPEAANILIPTTIPPAQARQYFLMRLRSFFPFLPRGIVQTWDPDVIPAVVLHMYTKDPRPRAGVRLRSQLARVRPQVRPRLNP